MPLALPSIKVILGLVPVLQKALETINSFVGDDDDQARNDENISSAFNVVSTVLPLFDTFNNGGDVTLEDAKEALADNDEDLATLDAEIARQEAAGNP